MSLWIQLQGRLEELNWIWSVQAGSEYRGLDPNVEFRAPKLYFTNTVM